MADVLVNGSDAVLVELEHREGAALVVLPSCRRNGVKKTESFGS